MKCVLCILFLGGADTYIIKVSNKHGLFFVVLFCCGCLSRGCGGWGRKGKGVGLFSFLKNHDYCLQKAVFCTEVKPLIFSVLPLDITYAREESDLLFAFLQHVFFDFFEAIF